MKFEKSPTICQPDCWKAGIYKIVCYRATGRPVYYAYFKPAGWRSWGQSVVSGRDTSFANLHAAKSACNHHAATFPTAPIPNDKIVGRIL